jgi:hypothetical protein
MLIFIPPMNFLPEIKPLVGFNSLEFWLFPKDAEAIFGMPEETQTLADEIFDTESFVMHYWDQGFSLFFDNLKDQRFSSVEVDNYETVLFGKQVFTMREKELIELMSVNGHKLSDTENQDWGEKRLSFDTAGIDFYFENSKLQSINFGVIEDAANFQYFPN